MPPAEISAARTALEPVESLTVTVGAVTYPVPPLVTVAPVMKPAVTMGLPVA